VKSQRKDFRAGYLKLIYKRMINQRNSNNLLKRLKIIIVRLRSTLMMSGQCLLQNESIDLLIYIYFESNIYLFIPKFLIILLTFNKKISSKKEKISYIKYIENTY
jgi:hypothetical protein